MNIKLPNPTDKTSFSIHKPVLKVLGLGGGGCNAVNRMIELEIEGVEFINANTDYQTLLTSRAATNIQLGPTYTRGLGAGGKPIVGLRAAQESRRELREVLQGADMVVKNWNACPGPKILTSRLSANLNPEGKAQSRLRHWSSKYIAAPKSSRAATGQRLMSFHIEC